MLIDYGIQNEESLFRIHVCAKIGRIYLFETKKCQEILKRGPHREGQAFTAGQLTGLGKLIRVEDIPQIRHFDIPADMLAYMRSFEHADTSGKGQAATKTVLEMIQRGIVTLPIIFEDEKNLSAQIRGIDLIVSNKNTIQVKCDWKGGDKSLGGTGNLFIQIAERNPYGKH